ncbi:conserved hypothetical protein [Thermococcus sp. AM4]|nr:conserved hypothetical protein [Thermococcus sp. AM4]
MVLEPLRIAFRYPHIKVGFTLLLLALLIAIAGTYGVSKSYHESGTLKPGLNVLGNGSFERDYYYYNRTLVLKSNYGEVKVNNVTYQVYGTLNLTLNSRPRVELISGNVSYEYTSKAVDYPFAPFSLISFLFFLVGLVLSVMGYMRMMSDLRSG